MPNSTTTIPEGFTYEYLPHGFFTALVGIILTFALHWSCAIILIAGILIAASKTGVEINPEMKTMRKYTSWTLFKTGEWLDLTQITQIDLGYQDHGAGEKNLAGQIHTSAKTFDLILIKKSGKEVVFNQFLKVGLAFRTLDTLNEVLTEIPINNYVTATIKHKKATRTRR